MAPETGDSNPENENPGALAGATGAWSETACYGTLGRDHATKGGAPSSGIFYWDTASHSVQPLRDLRAVLA